MVMVQPQFRAAFGYVLASVLGCALCLGAGVSEGKGQEQKTDPDRARQLKSLLEERHKTLYELMKDLQAQYRQGTVDFGRVVRAMRELTNAALDLDGSP